ncbi:hypothetical protein ACIBHX_36370 [Nonomuraea sp. NPDC050536]|uniref:hypothetical protein n=1 Tax=Nonomuraea sp. NPDC050536 TaxID=3364366 RepID=UPI0037C7FFF1
MLLIDRECVRRLLEATDPDAVLMFVEGECLVVPAARVDEAHRSLVVVHRTDVAKLLPGEDFTDDDLDQVASRLDNVVRDLGA